MNAPAIDWQIFPVAAGDRGLINAVRAAGLPVDDLAASGARFICGQSGGQLVGYGGLEICRPCCLLRSIVVLPGHRKSGHGRRIATALLDMARASGVEQAYLLTDGASDFFAGQGFMPVARARVARQIRDTRQFSELCPDDAVVMRLALGGRAAGLPGSR